MTAGLDLLDVGVRPRHELTGLGLVVEREVQALQVREEPLAQVGLGPQRDPERGVAAEAGARSPGRRRPATIASVERDHLAAVALAHAVVDRGRREQRDRELRERSSMTPAAMPPMTHHFCGRIAEYMSRQPARGGPPVSVVVRRSSALVSASTLTHPSRPRRGVRSGRRARLPVALEGRQDMPGRPTESSSTISASAAVNRGVIGRRRRAQRPAHPGRPSPRTASPTSVASGPTSTTAPSGLDRRLELTGSERARLELGLGRLAAPR